MLGRGQCGAEQAEKGEATEARVLNVQNTMGTAPPFRNISSSSPTHSHHPSHGFHTYGSEPSKCQTPVDRTRRHSTSVMPHITPSPLQMAG